MRREDGVRKGEDEDRDFVARDSLYSFLSYSAAFPWKCHGAI